MKIEITRLGEAFGLSANESKTLEIIIEYGSQAASRIAKLSKLPRNTGRDAVEKLVEKGLVSRVSKNGTHFYNLESPEKAILLLERKAAEGEKKLKQQKEVLAKLESTLASRQRLATRARVQVYEGVEGVERVYEDSLRSKETIRAWASFDSNQKGNPSYFPDYYRRRAKKRISIRSIHPDTPLTRTYLDKSKKELRHAKVSLKGANWSSEIQVYGDTVNIVSWEDRAAVLIESRAIAESFKEIFNDHFNSL